MNLTPATVFTGFLGAGKTTIIAHLIDHLQQRGEQVAYIKNEIGDADVDTQIMQRQHIQTKQLLNGCICCTLTGPFISAIDEIVETIQPSRIIIEASGTADVAALALMISSHPKLYRDGVLTVVDVVNFEGFEDLSITAHNQTKFTDLIIFNKIELVDLDRKRAVVGYVRELNTHSPIIEAPHGQLAPELVFGISSQELNNLLEDHQDHDTHDHEHQDHITGFHLDLDRVFAIRELEAILEQLPEHIFRVKGIVQTGDDKYSLVQKVGNRVDIQPLADQDFSQSRLVFIGYEADRAKGEVEKLVSGLIPKGSLRDGQTG